MWVKVWARGVGRTEMAWRVEGDALEDEAEVEGAIVEDYVRDRRGRVLEAKGRGERERVAMIKR